jgi:ABC-type transport system involved in multi-copper enzyme maturation permease subunit
VLVVRGIAVVPPALVVLGVLWAWWFSRQILSTFSPQEVLRWGLLLVEGMLLTAALVLTPALLAGTLAGEKVRSTLGLLLASEVSSGEIVLARLVGRLCVIGVVLLAGLPALVLLAALRSIGPLNLGILIVLPVAVAFGGGGLALAASALARRGRDALLVIYLVDLLLLLAPLFGSGLSPAVQDWVEPFNPYHGVGPLAAAEESRPALLAIGLWTLLGVAGTSWAAWRLRPAYLRDIDGRSSRWHLFRRRVPPVGDQPLVWKELYVEQTQAFSRFVYWLGLLVLVVYVGTSIVLAAVVAWGTWTRAGTDLVDWARAHLATWTGASWPISWLVQWSLGLRAAAAIASERQCGTWDALLASPLEGREIVLAKIYGGLYGLRGFVAAVVLAWTSGVLCGALTIADYGTLVANTLVVGAFMVVIGIGCSLSCATATRAMTFVIVGWLAMAFATAALSGLFVLVLGMMVTIFWIVQTSWAGGFGTGPVAGPPLGAWLGAAYVIGRLLLYGLVALVVAGYCRLRFDRLAGRSFPQPVGPARTWKKSKVNTPG